MIELHEASVKYGKRQAISNITMTVERGKFIGLIGSNGSGKTTLLKMMGGLLTPDSGRAELSGEPMTRSAVKRVAYMADTEDFFTYLNTKQLFDYYESQFPDFDRVKAINVADFLRVPMDEKLKHLSKGSKGRAKIAATFGREADFYLLDEPFSGLDPMVRREIAQGLIQYADPDRQTVVMSTHEIQEAEPLFDQLFVLCDGELIAENTVDGIRDEYNMDTTSWLVSLFNKRA